MATVSPLLMALPEAQGPTIGRRGISSCIKHSRLIRAALFTTPLRMKTAAFLNAGFWATRISASALRVGLDFSHNLCESNRVMTADASRRAIGIKAGGRYGPSRDADASVLAKRAQNQSLVFADIQRGNAGLGIFP
ncbi:hypothetical protein [Cypionkella sp.]|uniref:hypothetical protein n=1 Tax=Cypionkella sp. TaxID=2811411 RepID=UPI0027175FF9|nr:hypothetical protein [Cypionkella sp.]MDO8984098.1 hypothetical protein [Cypionkella sp.]MDP2047772.1 hypothetical protein [Cypionkella sp.]